MNFIVKNLHYSNILLNRVVLILITTLSVVRMRKFFTLFMLSMMIGLAYAHQPRLVSDGVTQIENPEISQAFYSELDGEPEYYKIISDEDFNFYVQILVPALDGIDKDVSVEVTYEHEEGGEHEDEPLFLLDGTNHSWTIFFEEFAGDTYYEGPEDEAIVGPGTYNIKVFSPDNEGKYVLVVGMIEAFPPDEIVKTLFALPQLKAEFFEKPAYTAYFNLTGLFVFGPAILVIAVLLFFFWRKRR